MLGRRWLVGIVAIAVVAVGAVGISAMRTIGASDAPNVLTAPAVVGDIEVAVLATGTLQPAQVVDVGAETSGRIIAMNVRLGDQVRAGDLIAVIDSAQLENQVRQAESQVTQMQANLRSMTSNLEFQQSNVEREQTLMDRGIGTQSKLDQVRNQFNNATANLTEMENRVRERELNLENALTNLEKANIRAPIDGVIAEIVAREGQTISTNQQVPVVVKLATMNMMTVRAQISEADIVKVQPGQKVYFTILGEPERRHYATLRARELTPAGGVLDPSGGGVQRTAIYYNALFEAPNDENIFFPGMTAEVHVVLDEALDVLTVPSAALGGQDGDGAYSVRVVGSDGKLETRKVAVGLNNNFIAEVRSGLQPGDEVVIGEAGGTSAAQAQPLFGRPTAPKT
jgi:macrolide-specific efflux system membrane fusion protein